MTRLAAVALLAAVVSAGDGLDGKITRGRARKFVDEAMPLIKQGNDLYRSWRLDEIAEADLSANFARIVKLYVKASDLLQLALDLKEDAGVTGQQRILCRRLVRLRAQIFFRRPHKHPQPAHPPAKNSPRPPSLKPPTRAPKPEPQPDPPVQPAPGFKTGEPPASPAEFDLPILEAAEDALDPAARKADASAISRMLKDYYRARKVNVLHVRHRLCRGQGCEQCGQTGRQINLFFFRKVFWNCFSPSLRSAPGALDALKAFHARAHTDIHALGPAVKSFSIRSVEDHGYWAKVRVEEKTKAGSEERKFTLIQAGGGWSFYTPATDQELLLRLP